MFNLKNGTIVSLLLTAGLSYAASPDMKKVAQDLEQTCLKFKSEKDFAKRFVHIKNLQQSIEREQKKVTDQNYQAEQDHLFELNFYLGNLLNLDTAFPKSDCQFQQERLIANFSDKASGEIHPNLKIYADKLITLAKCLCDEEVKK